MEDGKFAVLFAATILAARKLSDLEAQGITRPCPAREMIITDAISKAEEIGRLNEALRHEASIKELDTEPSQSYSLHDMSYIL